MADSNENVSQERKPAAQLSDQQIVTESRELHAQFRELSERLEQAPPAQRAVIREEMAPLVTRENELRQEASGRLSQELKQDRVPEQQMGYCR